MSPVKAYKRSPTLTNSTWYKGMLMSQMAGSADNERAFDVTIARMRPGTEPPPHVYAREDEFFFVLAGEMSAYVDGEVLSAVAGECVFLPRQRPHAWLITSEEMHAIVFITPGGFNDAFNKMNVPAKRMEIPSDRETVTYAEADLTETINVFEQHGLRLLSPDEVRREMPQYPR